MSTYVVATYKITDPEMLGSYQQAVFPTIQAFGGKILVAGQPEKSVEGKFSQDVLVVIEFDSIEDAEGWYNSDEYKKIRHLRHNSTVIDWAVFAGQFAIPAS